MATGNTIRIARVLLCLLVAFSLNAQLLAGTGSANDYRTTADTLSLASQSAAIRTGPGTQRFENSKQRTPVEAPFVLLASSGQTADRGCAVLAGAKLSPPRPAFSRARRGRSPPRIS